MTTADERILAETSLERASAIWMARLKSAGLDPDEGADDLDEEELRRRDEQRHHAQRTIESYALALTLFIRWAARQGRSSVSELQLDDLLAYARSLRRRSYDLSQRAQQAREAGQEVERLSPRTIH